MMKNSFYLILKALFAFKYLNSCLDFFNHVKKQRIQKVRFVIQDPYQR